MSELSTRLKKTYSSLSLGKKSIIWFTCATIIQNGIQFIVTPIFTRLLSDAEYGIYSIFQSWQQIFAIISVVALDRCITVGFMKFSNSRKQFLSSIQTLMTVLVFFTSFIVLIFYDFFESVIQLPLYIIITMLLVSLMNNTLSNWSWYQRYNFNYRILTFVTIFSTIFIQLISILCIIFLPFNNKGIILVMSNSGSRLLLYGIVYIMVFIKGKTAYEPKFWKFGLSYSIAVVPHALAQIILNSSDRIMIDRFCSREETAYYGVTYSSAMVLNIIITSISSAVQPWYFEKIKTKDFTSIRKTTNMLLVLSALLSILGSLFAPEILKIMAPSSYAKALWIFPSIAASVYFNSMYLYFANFESYFEKPFYFSIATTTGAIVNIILNLILIPFFGFIAAGYTTLFCYILFAIMHYIFMKKICAEQLGGVKIFNIKFILLLSLIVILLTLGITILYSNYIIRYFIIIFLMIVIYVKRHYIISLIQDLFKT